MVVYDKRLDCHEATPLAMTCKAFTLAEVLITLVIIGVIAAITVPSVLTSTQDKEYHSKFKKMYSTIENALRKAQVDKGELGYNTSIFTEGNTNLQTATELSKYISTIKICKNSGDKGCSEYYPSFKSSSPTYTDGFDYIKNHALLVLNDGAFMYVHQYPTCEYTEIVCAKDENGNCKTDGSTTTWQRISCGIVTLDVNGLKKPNKFGKDVYMLNILKDRISIDKQAIRAGQKGNDILINKI